MTVCKGCYEYQDECSCFHSDFEDPSTFTCDNCKLDLADCDCSLEEEEEEKQDEELE